MRLNLTLNRWRYAFLAMLFLWTGTTTGFAQKYPENIERFISEMQNKFQEVQQLKEAGQREQLQNKIREVHRTLMHNYPVYYDWWLQDEQGNGVSWFRGTLHQQLNQRLKKLSVSFIAEDTAESISKGFETYLSACEKRRTERLKTFVQQTPEIVFTKFRTLLPSFYAYTEGLSDARHECNFFAGGSLSLLKMDGIWGDEETLLSDPDGVFRDPNIHFDGQHVIFAWKKSLKEDDFHLYEMDLKSREVKQLTEGLGYADIEPIYLPDDNILFNSTRCGTSVDCWYTEVSNLFLCNRQATDFYLLLIPGDKPFKTKYLSAQIGSSRLSFAKPEYMEQYLDITPGSVSVMGLMNDKEKKVRLLIDKDVLQDEYFACHPCINTSSLRFKTSDLMEKVIPAMGHEPTMVCL